MAPLIGWSHAAEEPADLAELGPGFPATVALERGDWVGAGPRGDRDATRSRRAAFRLWSRGEPDAVQQGTKAAAVPPRFDVVQVLSEPNLRELRLAGDPDADVEEWPTDEHDCAAWLGRVLDAAGPGHRVGLTPFSPHPSARLGAWLAAHGAVAARCIALLAHVYGDEDEMWTALAPVLALARDLGKRVWVTECGPKKGQAVDAFAAALPGFLDRVAREAPEVDVVAVFAPHWPDPDPGWAAPLRLAGTSVERAMRAWTPPPPEEPMADPKLMTVAMWRQGGDLPRLVQRACAVASGRPYRTPRGVPLSAADRREAVKLAAFARQTPEGLRDSLLAGGFAVACADCYQGTTIQGVFSHTSIDFGSVDDVVALAKLLFAAGIRFWPMVNPHGAAAEPALYLRLCRTLADALGEAVPLMSDFEFGYPGFFPNDLPAARAHLDLIGELFQQAGLPWALVPDPRQPGRDYPKDLLPAVPLFFQVYHEDFGTSIEDVFARYMKKADWPQPIHPVVQGDAPTRDLARAAELAVAGGFPCLVVWGYGSMVHTPDPTDVDDFSVLAARAGPYVDLFGAAAPPAPAPAALSTFLGRAWDALTALERAVDGFDPGDDQDLVALRSGLAGVSGAPKMLIRATKRLTGLE